MYKVTLLILCVLLIGCAGKPIQPKMSVYSLEDLNYPCVKIAFPDQVRLERVNVEESDENVALVYQLNMPGYKVEVVKLYSKKGNWGLEGLPTLKDVGSVVYDIPFSDQFPDRSAVVTIEERAGEIYIVGSVGEYLQSDKAVRIDITRKVKVLSTFNKDGIDKWRNSTAGNRTIKNMQTIVDSIYQSIEPTECTYKESIDNKWWNY